jgi:hypothetical protein
VVLDLNQVPPPVHIVVSNRAPAVVGSALEDAQSKGLKMAYVSLGVGVGVGVQLYKWWRRLGLHRRIVPAAPGIGGSTLVASQRGGSVPWN